jgi:prepilin-type N-terminal cleavage/methylation domain-containing protein
MTARIRRGFTLWEMTIVFAIMAVTALLVVPQWASLNTDEPDSLTDAVLHVLRDSRKLAIASTQTVALRIDPVNGLYRVDTTGVSGSGLYAEGQLDLGALESIETDRPRLQFVFRPSGAAFADTLLVRGTRGTSVIAVDPWSGVAGAYAR